MGNTLEEFDAVIKKCRSLLVQKHKDYGDAWRIMRLPSITDQIMIKAFRIRSVEMKGTNTVGESIENEFVGIINYSLMALMQHESETTEGEGAWSETMLLENYNQAQLSCRSLLADKNDDYAEIWRAMRVSSMTDMIIMKLKRIKQLEDKQGKTLVSEGVDAGYRDIVNYSVFALILLGYV
ncbi:MAG: DUF1599 domain-containing protein [Saprospiraceae bacterium]|nr:DUF1599 domain-containing protein [Saprospiraceae bacterium]MBL0294654.1 DUF1599 domain-containing protein [Saprospiraceae bacterium]